MTRYEQADEGRSPAWTFREIRESEPERLPRELEFFVGGDLDLADSLVREAIQNSLDARRQLPVRVRFTFLSRIMGEDSPYYAGLVDHARASRILEDGMGKDTSVRLLLVEDFNTVGLTGSIVREQMPEGGSSNYYNFWWREGVAEKQGRQGGRWGLGKITLHAVSGLRAFWGVTKRHDDGRTLLLGKTLLKPHYRDGVFFDYYGYFGSNGCRPIHDQAIINDFSGRFGIDRTADPGLSLVIPMVLDEIDSSAIVRAVIMHYFLPIARGELVAEIRPESTSTLTVDSSTLAERAREQDWSRTSWKDQDIDALLDFVGSVRNLEDSDSMMQLNSTDGSTRISASWFGASLEALQGDFRSGKVLGFRIPVEITPARKSPVSSFFTVFVKKCEGLDRAEEFYWRSGIRIANIRLLGRQQVRTVLSADDEAVSRFLGDSETPAHAEWNERTQGFKDKYVEAIRTLRFVRGAVRDVMRLLDIPPAGRESDFLKEIFSVSQPDEQQGRRRTVDPDRPPPRRPRHLEVSGIHGGVRIWLSDAHVSLPIEAEARVAYDVRRGNPFRRYSNWDFDLGRMQRKISGGKELGVSDNKVVFRVNKKKFDLKITGFDPRRDVVVLIEER